MRDLACLNPGLTILPSQQPCAFRHRLGYSHRLTKTGLTANRRLVYTRYVHVAPGRLVSRPRPRPWPPGLETKTKTLATRSRDQDQDLGSQVSRSRSYYQT